MSHYLHVDVEAERVRAMLEKKREMDAAWDAYHVAKRAYLKAQDELTGSFPAGERPGPYVCGDMFIEAESGYERRDCEVKFEYTQATRVRTSE